MFTRLENNYSIMLFILLSLSHFINNYISYYDKMNMKDNILKLHQVHKILYIAMTFVILIGYYKYYTRQRIEKGSNWSTSKFVFGTPRCNYINKT